MSGDWAVGEDYWPTLDRDPDDDRDEDVPETVLDRVVEQLDPDRIHGIEFHGSNGRAYYGVVAYSGRHNGMDVLDLRTVVVDLRDETVKIHDNGLWIPRFEGAAQALTSIVARASNDLGGSCDEDAPPVLESAINTSAESILSHEIEDDYVADDGDGWGATWGNGNGEPPETHTLVDRLEQADVPTDRFSRLNFGEKTPFERYGNRGTDSLLGNYGVETGVPGTTLEADVDSRVLENDPLVIIDVDYPEQAPLEDFPETFAVSSARGSDERAHHYVRCTDKQAVYDYFGSWGVQSPSWGEVWLAGEYVVGPGCKTSDGRYEIVTDVPMATLTAAELIDLCEQGSDDPDEADDVLEDLEAGHPEPVDDVDEDDQEDVDDDRDDEPAVECHDCGAEIDPGTARLVDRDGSPAYVCPGGECNE